MSKDKSKVEEFVVSYAFDCSCYGRTTILAATPEAAKDEAKRLYQTGRLMADWEATPDCGTHNHRIVDISSASDFASEVNSWALRPYNWLLTSR